MINQFDFLFVCDLCKGAEFIGNKRTTYSRPIPTTVLVVTDSVTYFQFPLIDRFYTVVEVK